MPFTSFGISAKLSYLTFFIKPNIFQAKTFCLYKKHLAMRRFYTFLLLSLLSNAVKAQFYVTPDTNFVQIVNNFVLSGVTVANVQFTGDTNTLGTFTGGNLTNLGLNDGIALTTGSFDTVVNPGVGSPVGSFANFYNYFPGDSLLNTLIAPWTTYDAANLEFDLSPAGNVLEFQYVFASEEYPEYVGSSFNDVFGFFINGPDPAGGSYQNYNIARLPVSMLPVAINNVNDTTNSAYFIDNQAIGGQTIVYDGFTTVFTAQVNVIPAATYHLKMTIADAGDGAFDSGIFLKAQSMKSYLVTSTNETASLPSEIYPNPINPNSLMKFKLNQAGEVTVCITDRAGRLIHNSVFHYGQAGGYSINIGKMMNNYPQGIYFVNIRTVDESSFIKVIK